MNFVVIFVIFFVGLHDPSTRLPTANAANVNEASCPPVQQYIEFYSVWG